MYDRHDLRWQGNHLHLHSGRLLATIEPDQKWKGMWRVRFPDGYVTDMTNLTRAKDAAACLALAAVNRTAAACAVSTIARPDAEVRA